MKYRIIKEDEHYILEVYELNFWGVEVTKSVTSDFKVKKLGMFDSPARFTSKKRCRRFMEDYFIIKGGSFSDNIELPMATVRS